MVYFVNEDQCYYIGANSLEKILPPNNIHYAGAKGYHWYVRFFDFRSFDKTVWEQILPAGALSQIRRGFIKLVLHNYVEAFTNYLDPLYQLLVLDFGINEKNIILCTGARDIVPVINDTAKKYGRESIRVVLTSEFEQYLIAQVNRNRFEFTHDNVQFKKKFINFNRRWRPHRSAFVSLLKINGLLDDGYVSFMEVENQNWNTGWDQMINLNPLFKTVFEQHKNELVSMPPLIIDKDSLDYSPDWYLFDLHTLLPTVYRNSYFSIVSETNFYNTETRFLTEKTYKTIAFKHPFLLLGPPHILKYFRERGYQTFSTVIDESYDDEVDDGNRMLMILNETKRLCSLNNEDLSNFLKTTREICECNYRTLMSKTEFNVTLA